MNRLPNWEQALDKVVSANRHRLFKRGEFDCTRFAHLCLKAVYGKTPFDSYRQDHTTKAEAFAYLREVGLKTPWGLMSRHADRKQPTQAKRGDIIGHRLYEAFSLGVCLGNVFAAPGDDGLEFIPMREAVRAWSLDG